MPTAMEPSVVWLRAPEAYCDCLLLNCRDRRCSGRQGARLPRSNGESLRLTVSEIRAPTRARSRQCHGGRDAFPSQRSGPVREGRKRTSAAFLGRIIGLELAVDPIGLRRMFSATSWSTGSGALRSHSRARDCEPGRRADGTREQNKMTHSRPENRDRPRGPRDGRLRRRPWG